MRSRAYNAADPGERVAGHGSVTICRTARSDGIITAPVLHLEEDR